MVAEKFLWRELLKVFDRMTAENRRSRLHDGLRGGTVKQFVEHGWMLVSPVRGRECQGPS